MKLFSKFSKNKVDASAVPPELQQYYQVPTEPAAKRHLPVVLILVGVILVAALLALAVVFIFHKSASKKASSSSNHSSVTQTVKSPTPRATENPANTPDSDKTNNTSVSKPQ
jgi:flagellar basal body-associated protein FliL